MDDGFVYDEANVTAATDPALQAELEALPFAHVARRRWVEFGEFLPHRHG